MKTTRICALAVLAVLLSTTAFADGINDPKIIIRGVSGSAQPFAKCPTCNSTKVGMNFTFGVPERGSGTLFFTNASGKNWTSLALIENGTVPAGDITCKTYAFTNCATKTLKNGSVEILLSGVRRDAKNDCYGGIRSGSTFSINFVACGKDGKNCPGWPGDLDFTAHAMAAPEPGTIALMLTGVGAVFSRRKVWKNRFNS